MKDKSQFGASVPGAPRPSEPRRVRLPGFAKEEIGLGDVIKRVTYAMGIPTCKGCEQRARALNRWVKFTR